MTTPTNDISEDTRIIDENINDRENRLEFFATSADI